MRKFNLNFGVMLAAIVLFLYTYISFLGMLYKYDGVLWKATLHAASVLVLVSACVYSMVNAKVTKSKEVGLVGQIVFGCIILVIFLTSGGPFTSFLKVVASREAINTEISKVKESALNLDNHYNNYVSTRITDYRNNLVSGNELRVQSLQRRLSPDSIGVIQRQREEWLSRVGDISILNIDMPNNLEYMRTCVTKWTDNYKQLSAMAYDNEPLAPFEYNEFDTSLNKLMDNIKNAGYSIWAILVALISALIMMFPYWLAIPTQTRTNKEITYV